ncbi:hypothetical protein I8752_30735 [Nostocaceae cyanobacterium CENA369]|uniref:Uncharacterized protein n=1 Tax=Dendronalium phyllosphericum CENA369 TaxID=1725256 RepID=A0A8J7ICV4_9NOST|nr:hypothetical protein [Dendronalium phyllosphericum]MBH8577268.1 hypothetical protein [Dendronalium phyllosphericum CENA369]
MLTDAFEVTRSNISNSFCDFSFDFGDRIQMIQYCRVGKKTAKNKGRANAHPQN